MGEYRPGESVPRSGVFRVYHSSHRLMHEATLLMQEIFPCCRQCGNEVSFELIRRIPDNDVLPFRSGEILQEYPPKRKTRKRAG